MELRTRGPAATRQDAQPTLVRGLSPLDTILLLVGGIIGSAVFLTGKDLATQLPSPLLFISVWLVGGAITMLACFAFAELGAMFPEAGGQYVYLREAYGELVAFLYGWMSFTVYNSGGIATLAVGFARYSGALIPAIAADKALMRLPGWTLTRGDVVAIGCIALLTVINVLGLRKAAILQNVATWLKFGALVAFLALGFTLGKGSWEHFKAPAATAGATVGWGALSAFGVALIAVFWAFDGWTYVGYAAGEVRDPQKSIPRALILGIAVVAAIYIGMNAVYLYALPLKEIAQHETIAETAAVRLFSPAAGWWASAVIALSCFGANSSAVLAGARVYYAMAKDGVFFRRMANVHPRFRTPAFSLVAQGVWSSLLTLSGRYDQLFTYVMFMGVLSFVLTVGGLFILRKRRPDLTRPYRCTGYPFLPGLYMVVASLWAANALWERPKESLGGLLIVGLGVPLYFYWRRMENAKA